MFTVNSYLLAVIFCIVTMICWGSWSNTQKLVSKNWRYELFYWDNAWISLGTQVATMDADCLQFNQVPQNVLMLLVPEYSERKERPFIIMPDGTRYWW